MTEHTVDLSPSNSELYKGCVVRESGGKLRLETPMDSATTIVGANALEMLRKIPDEERRVLILTGAAPPTIYLTVYSMLAPFFEKVVHLNGIQRTEVEIPQPPPEVHVDEGD
ncbi:MAG: hypothetical protein WC767_02085 [Candidatus Paceibacterota bacterium]|jgi:hypothetical protein